MAWNNGLRFGTWNIRTLYRAGALQTLTNELKRYRMDIVALQEIRWTGNGEQKLDDYMLLYGGNTTERHELGTGFMIKRKLWNSLINFTAMNERLSMLRLQTKKFKITLLNIHAPTEETDQDIKDDFYETLEGFFDSIPKTDNHFVRGF